MVQSVISKINEDEAALYDRQIRLWGLEAQNRLRNSSVLLFGVNALGAEMAKNLMLAGLKSLTLMDDAFVTENDVGSQFFVSAEALRKNRAEASLNACQQLNPLVKVVAETSKLDEKTEDFYKQFDIICIILDGSDLDARIVHINDTCRRLGVKFCCAGSIGWFGFSFNDFIDHEFVEEVNVTDAEAEPAEPAAKKTKTSTEEADQHRIIKNVESFVSFGDAMKLEISAENRAKWKRVSPGFFLLQILRKFSQKFGRFPKRAEESGDVVELETMKKHLIDEMSSATGQAIDIPHFSPSCLFGEVTPVCAIVGGVLAQEIIKAVSGKDQPLNNFFFYNGFDFTGTVGKFPIS